MISGCPCVRAKNARFAPCSTWRLAWDSCREPPFGVLSGTLPNTEAPRVEHSVSCQKTAPHFLCSGNGALFATAWSPYLLQTPCVLGCFVGLSTPGTLACRFRACPWLLAKAMSVMRVGSGCVRGGVAWPSARLNYRAVSPWRVGDGSTMANQVGAAAPWRAGGVPGNNASTKPTPGASVRLGAPPPCPLPQPRQTGFAPLSPEQERWRVRAIRPFPPWPCGPFP